MSSFEGSREGAFFFFFLRKKKEGVEIVSCAKAALAEIKLSDFCFSSVTTHQLRVQGELQEIGLMGGENRTAFQMLEGKMAPTMNVLQCASATCFYHRFAMLSCLNLIGWRGGWEGRRQQRR